MKRVSVWRMLGLVLAAVAILSLQVPSVWAAEAEEISFSFSATRVNPLYATDNAPAMPIAEDEGIVHTAADFRTAVKELRKIFKNREVTATLELPVELESDFSDAAALWEELAAFEEALYQETMAHTGKADEGDALRWSYYQYDYRLSLREENGNIILSIGYQIAYHTTAQQEAELSAFVTAMLSTWQLENATDYEKVCAVYDWLCENVTYADPVTDPPGTIYCAYGAIMEWESVCQGYAAAMYRMLLELGVDCRIITGTGNGGPHAWNIVKLGDYYYNADATWDAVWMAAGVPYDWFLTCDESFLDHYRDPEYMTERFYEAYPMGQEDYTPSTPEQPDNQVTWELTQDGILIISGSGDMEDYDAVAGEYAPWADSAGSVKKIVIEDGVTSIGYGAFAGCSNVTEIDIAESVTKIGVGAFLYCERLADIKIPSGVTGIDACAFAGTALTNVPTMGEVTVIPYAAFLDCLGMVDITIPQNITVIDQMAFGSCDNLRSVTIPDSIISIQNYAFAACENLESVYFMGDAPEFSGNSIFGNVEATVYYPADNATWTEAVMQNYGGNITWEPYGEEETLCAFYGTSVSLGDSLDMHFFLDGDDVDMTDYALITRSYGDGRADEEIMIPGSWWGVLDDGSVYVTYEGIAAKEMGDIVTITIYDFEGNAVSETYADSVQDYAMRMLEKESDQKLLTLLVDMLNYGAEAQTYFGYMEEALVNADLTQAQKGYATASYEAEDILAAGRGRAATALTLKNRIRLDLLFDCGVTGTDFASLYAVVTYTDHYGYEQELWIEGQDFVEAEGNRVCVSVPGLAIADYGQAVTCTVYDAQGNVIAWVTDSIGGYVARMGDRLPDMVAAIAKFGSSAYNYFH